MLVYQIEEVRQVRGNSGLICLFNNQQKDSLLIHYPQFEEQEI